MTMILLIIKIKLITITILSNGNRTEWSPNWSVIMNGFKKSQVMITDRIGRQEILFPIYYKNKNFRKTK